jgi:microcystin-dependent protein
MKMITPLKFSKTFFCGTHQFSILFVNNMKRTLLALLFLLALVYPSLGQNDIKEKGFTFQGYARDFSGNALGNETVFVKFSIYADGGAVHFQETQEVETDAFGVFTNMVGAQNQAQFYSLDWINNAYNLKVEVSTNNSDYVTISDYPLVSVPYAQAAERAKNGVPAGSITPFAGDVDVSLPDGYLVCDGRSVRINDYPELYDAIGTNWGGDGSTTFRLPDLRGYFLRGVADASTVDPGKNSRGSRNGSNSGNRVGSFQDDEFKSHNHGVTDPGHTHDYRDKSNNSEQSDNANDRWVGSDAKSSETRTSFSSTTGISINNSGGSETRPKNAYVWYIIKY